MPRPLAIRGSVSLFAFAAIASISCGRRNAPAPATPNAYPSNGYAAPAPQYPPPPPAAQGWACTSDADLRCPFSRCIGGACGGCLSDAECKPGNQCTQTPWGLACNPRLWTPTPNAAPAPAPTVFVPRPSPTPSPVPSSGDEFAVARQRCVAEINGYRASMRLPALAQRPDKEPCSDTDARGDAQTGRAHGGSGKCGFSAQNECPGWGAEPIKAVVDCSKMMFDEGPGEPYSEHGHYINMTRPQYRGVACGFHRHSDGKLWIVQNFF